MKICVLNSSGNVGKSTIVKNFLYPRLSNSLIIEIETINSSNINVKNMNVINFDLREEIEILYMKMLENENVIVDLGASNISNFFEKVLDFEGFLEIFDYFVIPSVSTIKETEDTIKTFKFLEKIGVHDKKIKIIGNKIKSDFKKEFSILFKNLDEIEERAYIKDSKLFSNLSLLKMSIEDVFQNDLDFYKQKILDAETAHDKMRIIKMDMSNRMSHVIIRDFDSIFEILFNQKPFSNFSFEKDIKKEKKEAKKTEKKEENLEENLEEAEDF